MKTIATFSKPEEAHLLRIRLESVGIPAFVQDEAMVQLDWLYSNAIGGVRVQVADEEVEEAQQLLREDRGVEEIQCDPRCPKCGSTALETEAYSKRIAFLSVLLLLIPLIIPRKRIRCTACLHTW
ncbi:MAG: DUF2007 domain-containing protein [Chthoniobacteraceae bacterium]